MEEIVNKYELICNKLAESFFDKSLGCDYFIMSFDAADLKEISQKLQIESKDVLKVISEYYLGYHERGQNYTNWPLGIAAFQVYFASQMGSFENFGDGEYNPVLADNLNIDITKLQTLYETTQDSIWKSVKDFILSLGFKTNIPSPRNGPGRYVQYPKSQAYFNQNDLTSFKNLLANNSQLRTYMEIGMISFFKILCREDLSNIAQQPLTTRAINLIKDSSTNQEILKSQLFNYFCNLDDFELNSIEVENTHFRTSNLFYDDNNNFYLIDSSGLKVDIDNLNIKQDLLTYNITNQNTKFLILKRDPAYGDYYQVAKANLGDQIKILILDPHSLVYQYILRHNPTNLIEVDNIKIYNLTIPIGLPENDHLFNYIINSIAETPLNWVSGIKLNRNTYLKGYGPQFIVNYKTRVFINKTQHEYIADDILDLSKFEIGHHTIQPINGRIISFNITDSSFSNSPPTAQEGWDINTFAPSTSEYNISGLSIHLLNQITNFTIRNFIDISCNKKLNTLSGNQLFKTLTKYK